MTIRKTPAIRPPVCDGFTEISPRHRPAPPTSASTASIRMISDVTSAMPVARFGLAERSVTLEPIEELLPGESVELSAELADVPALFLATTTVRIEPIDPSESAAAGEVAATVSRDRFFAPPITFLILLLILGFITLEVIR